MSEREGPPSEPRPDEVPVVGQVVMKTTRFSREVLATMISLASAAFGVVAALAWNTAITEAFTKWLGAKSASKIGALFAYAVLVTLVGVLVIVSLGRLAGRINAEPVEFKYPAPPKTGPSTTG
jgi:uncharacterized membrane protein YjjP (DUF1212 family)